MKRRGCVWLLVGCVGLLAACGSSGPPSFSGFVNSPTSLVSTEISGRVVKIAVHEGERVKTGALLVQLDSGERAAAVAQAQAGLDRAQAALKEAQSSQTSAQAAVKGASAQTVKAQAALVQAKQNETRTRRLAKGKAVTRAQIEAAHAQLLEAQAAVAAAQANQAGAKGKAQAAAATVANARAGVASAQAALSLAKVQLSQTEVRAPFDGLVVNRDVHEGEWVAPGTPVITFENPAVQWVRFDVGETHLSGLALGTRAEIRLVALPDRRFEGHVSQIAAEGEFALDRDVKRGRPDIRAFRVRVSFDRPSPKVRPGMTAEVTVPGLGSGP